MADRPAPHRRRTIASLLTGLVLVLAAVASADTWRDKPRVVVLNSYHPRFRWTESEMDGLMSELGLDVDYLVEFMDAKRRHGDRYTALLDSLFIHKYLGREADLLVTTDDAAFDYIRRRRHLVPDDVPWVFCGVNAWQNGLLDGLSGVTGAVEIVDFAGTLDTALRLFPSTRRLVVVHDDTPTSRAERARLDAVLPLYGPRLEVRDLVDLPMADLRREVAALEPGDLVFYLTYVIDEPDLFLDYPECLELVREVCPVPIVGCWDFLIGHGIVGGRLTSGHRQGELAGKLGRRILDGEPVDRLPVVHEPPGRFIFDHRELQRFGIDRRRLPPGSSIIGAPSPFLRVRRGVLLGVVAGLVALSAAVLALWRNVLRRQRAETALLEGKAQLEIALKHESLLSETASLLNDAENFKTVLDDVLRVCCDRLDVAKVSLYSLSEDDESSVVIGSRLQERGRAIRDLRHLPWDRINLLVDRLRRESIIVAPDLEVLDPAAREFYRGRNIGAIAIAAVTVGGRLVGLLGFSQPEPHPWSREETGTFTTLAAMIAGAWRRHLDQQARLATEQKHGDALQELEAASRLASLGVMAAGVTHEINQPLNAIRVSCDRARRRLERGAAPPTDPDGPSLADPLASIAAGAGRIDAIVRQMRRFWDPQPAPPSGRVDLNAAVRQGLGLLERQMASRGLEPRLDLAGEPLAVRAELIQIEQIVINLAVNALQALEHTAAPELRVTSRRRDGRLELSFADNGPGVPDADRERIFDPFYTSKGPGEGSGLGLAIVRRLAGAMDGRVDVTGNDHGGATFTLTVPAAT